jgi:hypothetical protein
MANTLTWYLLELLIGFSSAAGVGSSVYSLF